LPALRRCPRFICLTTAAAVSLLLQLCDLYENDCIFDKFGCCMNGTATCFASGTYSNTFKVRAALFGCFSAQQQQHSSSSSAAAAAAAYAQLPIKPSHQPMANALTAAAGSEVLCTLQSSFCWSSYAICIQTPRKRMYKARIASLWQAFLQGHNCMPPTAAMTSAAL
jgi:hypothetical protein